MRELMVFRVQVFRHLQQDWYDVINRAGSIWSPKWREIHHEDGDGNSYRRGIEEEPPTESELSFEKVRVETPIRILSESPAENRKRNDKDKAAPTVRKALLVLEDEEEEKNAESGGTGGTCIDEDNVATGGNSPAVLVEEDMIPDLWVPGRIMHIYSHRGQYKASMVPRDFPTLRKIEVQGHIFADHFGPTIFEALLEVHTAADSRMLFSLSHVR